MSDIPKYEDTLPAEAEVPKYEDTLPHPSEEASKEEPISQSEALWRGGLQGATLGLSDEGAGVLGVASNLGEVAQADEHINKIKELYDRYRDIERQRNKLAEETHPGTYMAGNVAGGIATTPFTGGLLGVGLKGAALTGAVAGFGTSEAEAPLEMAKDTALGAGLGYAGGKIGESISKYVSPAALETKAGANVGNKLKIYTEPSRRAEIGKQLLKTGALKEGVTEEAVNKVSGVLSDIENKELQPLLSRVSKDLSENLSNEQIDKSVGSLSSKLTSLADEALDSIKNRSWKIDEFNEEVGPKLKSFIRRAKEIGNDPVALNELKREASDEAEKLYSKIQKYRQTSTPIPSADENWEAMARKINAVIKNHIEDLGDLAEQGLGQEIKDINAKSGSLITGKGAMRASLIKPEQGPKLSKFYEYLMSPKYAAAKDVAKNIGPGLTKANMEMSLAEKLNKPLPIINKAIGENLAPVVEKVGEKVVSGTPSIENLEKLTGSQQRTSSDFDKDTPQTVSRTLYSQSNDQLKTLADSLSSDPSFSHSGAALNKALSENNMASKNSILFSLAQNPKARKLLVQKGLIKE